MSKTNTQNRLNAYRQVGVQSSVPEASPHRLVQMLMAGALERIRMAKNHMNQNQIPEKGESISLAISIIDGLMMSLDKEIGGEIATNLEALYDYMKRRLLEANLKNDSTILDEVCSLLSEIKSGWDSIPEEVKNAHQEKEQYGL